MSKNTNTNTLRGIGCPMCAALEGFAIDGTATFLVFDDGAEGFKNLAWSDDSPCTCLGCGHRATVREFTALPLVWVTVPGDPEPVVCWLDRDAGHLREFRGRRVWTFDELNCDPDILLRFFSVKPEHLLTVVHHPHQEAIDALDRQLATEAGEPRPSTGAANERSDGNERKQWSGAGDD